MIRWGTATFIQTLNFAAKLPFSSIAASLSGFRGSSLQKVHFFWHFLERCPSIRRIHLMEKDAVKTSYRVPTDSFSGHLINNLTNFLVMMKRIIVAGLALAVLAACNKDEPGPSPITDPIQEAPVADFDVTVNAYGIATFTNKSTNAIAYRWDFGDNRSSDRNSASVEENPTFTYTRTGTYTVTLSASNGYEVDVTSKEVVYSR